MSVKLVFLYSVLLVVACKEPTPMLAASTPTPSRRRLVSDSECSDQADAKNSQSKNGELHIVEDSCSGDRDPLNRDEHEESSSSLPASQVLMSAVIIHSLWSVR